MDYRIQLSIARKQLRSTKRHIEFVTLSLKNRENDKKNCIGALDIKYNEDCFVLGKIKAKSLFYQKYNKGITPLTRQISTLRKQLTELNKNVMPALTDRIAECEKQLATNKVSTYRPFGALSK